MSDEEERKPQCCLVSRCACCFKNPVSKILFSIPLGGLIGTIGMLYGYFYWFAGGLKGVDDVFKDNFKVPVPYLDEISMWIVVALFVADGLVTLWGFREKLRLCWGCPQQFNVCPAWSAKFFLKGITNIVVVIAQLAVLLLLIWSVAFYVLFFCMDTNCKFTLTVPTFVVVNNVCVPGEKKQSVKDVVKDLMKLIGTSSEGADLICGGVSKGMEKSLELAIGCAIITVAQIIICSYWMKYSTLGNVPFYWAEGDEATEGDLENHIELSPVVAEEPEKAKAPRKF